MSASCNRRLELVEFNKFRITEGALPVAPENGVIIKTAYAGVCHTDVHITAGHNLRAGFKLPRVMGHEISGTIHSLGAGVNKAFPDLEVGQRVSVYPWGSCMQCNYCKADHQCCSVQDLPEVTPGGPFTNQKLGIAVDGGYQQYVTVEYPELLMQVPSDLPMDVASLIPCSGITAFSAVRLLKDSMEVAMKVNKSALVAIMGAGGLALWAMQIAKALYPGVKIVAVDVLDEKLADAKKAGADYTYRWSKDATVDEAVAGLLEVCGKRPDGAIDFIGAPSVVQRAVAALNVNGTLVLIGLAGSLLPSDLSVANIIRRCLSLRGNFVGTKEQCRELMELVRQGKVKPPPIDHITVDQVEGVINSLKKGTQRGRAVVKY